MPEDSSIKAWSVRRQKRDIAIKQAIDTIRKWHVTRKQRSTTLEMLKDALAEGEDVDPPRAEPDQDMWRLLSNLWEADRYHHEEYDNYHIVVPGIWFREQVVPFMTKGLKPYKDVPPNGLPRRAKLVQISTRKTKLDHLEFERLE